MEMEMVRALKGKLVFIVVDEGGFDKKITGKLIDIGETHFHVRSLSRDYVIRADSVKVIREWVK